MSEILISLTSKAIALIKQIMQQRRGAVGFRLSMKKYGCNGYAYVPDVIEAINPNDIEIKAITELRVFVDPQFAKALNGTVIDYVKKGLAQSQLIFTNPNTEGECGCGESVNLKED